MIPPPQDLKLEGSDCTQSSQCTTGFCAELDGEKWCAYRCQNDMECSLGFQCQPVMNGRACR